MEERPHLYVIPIAHTYADMGNLEGKIPADERYEAAVTEYWVGETLPGGRTGLLFIGAAHDVGSLLSNEIRVSMPEIVSLALLEVLRDFYSLGEERK